MYQVLALSVMILVCYPSTFATDNERQNRSDSIENKLNNIGNWLKILGRIWSVDEVKRQMAESLKINKEKLREHVSETGHLERLLIKNGVDNATIDKIMNITDAEKEKLHARIRGLDTEIIQFDKEKKELDEKMISHDIK